MTEPVAAGWRLVRVVFDGQDVAVDGVNPWAYQWESVGNHLEVPHPSYPAQRHRLDVWRITTDTGLITFAAGELSNGVWCFYEPDPSELT